MFKKNNHKKMNFLRIFNIGTTKDVEGYESLQKRINEKNEFLEKVLYSFNELNKYLKEVFKRLMTLKSNFTNIQFSLEEQSIHEVCKLIFQNVLNNVEQDNRLVEEIIKNFSEHIKTFNKEKELYNEFKKLNKELQDEKEKLQKFRDIYHKTGKEAEKKIKKFVENNYQNLSNLSEEAIKELDNITIPASKAFNSYQNTVDNVNQLIDRFNDNQTIMFERLPELGNEDGVFFFRLIKYYMQTLEEGERYLHINKKQLNESKTVEQDSKLKELIEKNEDNKRDEKPISLVQYQSSLDFNKCKNKEEFDLFAKSVEMINKHISNEIFPNYKYELELKNYQEGQLLKELFDEKKLDEEKAQKFLESLKDESVHRAIYIVLSQLRTNSRFQRSRPLIELFGKAFEILLQSAEKNKLYENAKNCIILSQTYFYNDEENKRKIYVFEYIKNNKWLSNPKFWRGFIDYMMKKEFERFEKTFPETNFNVEQNINLTQRVKNKLNEVVFSQLLPFVSNMVDFGIDKRIVLKIADDFTKKYNYMTPSNYDSLMGIISNDKGEIEKLRTEYNQSLEPYLINKEEEVKKDLKVNSEGNTEEKKEINNTKEVKEENAKKEESTETNQTKEETKENISGKEETKNTEENDKTATNVDNN